MEKDNHANTERKLNFRESRLQNISGEKSRYFLMLKVQFLNMYVPNNKVSRYMRKNV
jgi:hypothetical protein